MSTSHPFLRQWILAPGMAVGALALLVLVLPGTARAQLTPDPYNIVGDYNSQYLSYIYPVAPSAGSVFPNSDRLSERSAYRTANQFEEYLNGIEESNLGDPGSGDRGSFDLRRPSTRSGPGVPYYKANREFDEAFGRVYRPNARADADYYSRQDTRNQTYFQALRATDPKKRAELLRQYNLDNLKSARELSSGRFATPKDRDKALELDRTAPDYPDRLPFRDEPASSLNRGRPGTRILQPILRAPGEDRPASGISRDSARRSNDPVGRTPAGVRQPTAPGGRPPASTRPSDRIPGASLPGTAGPAPFLNRSRALPATTPSRPRSVLPPTRSDGGTNP